MRRLSLLVAFLFGCTHAALIPVDSGGTSRLFQGEHVVGHYVSPSAYEHYLQAQLASLTGHSDEAADQIRRALVSDGSSAYLRTRLAEELMALGRLDEARDELESALRLDPAFAEAYVDLGRVHLQLGDAAVAERSFRRAFELDRTCEDAYLALASLYQERGDSDRAADVYRTLGDRIPRSSLAHYHLAHAASRRGDLALAETELRRAVDGDPGFVEACRELGELLVADDRIDAGRRELEGCHGRTGDPALGALLVDAELAAGRPERAARLVDKMVERPGSPERRIAVGWLLVERHLGDRAQAVVESLRHTYPGVSGEPPVRLLAAAVLEANDHPRDALAELRRVPSAAPEYVRAQLHIARILIALDRLDEASAGLQRAAAGADRLPDGESLWAMLAELRERAGDRIAAQHILENALRSRPGSETLLYALGHVLDRAGEWERAALTVRPILRKHPDSADAMRFIGCLYTQHGTHLDEARRLLESAFNLRPTSGEMADSLGWLHLKLGRLADAERFLARAGRLRADSPDVQAHLGALYFRKGDRVRALDAYRRALAHKPDEKLRLAVEEQVMLLETGRVGSR